MNDFNSTAVGAEQGRHLAFRLAAFAFAVLLAGQCAWLLLSELLRPRLRQLPADPASAAIATEYRDAAYRAAAIGAIRGDLWAEAAFTSANLLWLNHVTNTAEVLQPGNAIDRALVDGPEQSGAWLLLSGLALTFPSQNITAIETLKMAYYTGPSEQPLMSLRLRVAAQLEKFDDIELTDLVRRDIRLLLHQNQKSAIAAAYAAASSGGRAFIKQTVKDIDPAALGILVGDNPNRSVPD